MSEIEVKKNRGRTDFSGIADLVESVRKNGVIHPVCVRPGKNLEGDKRKWVLIAGERRYRACLLAGRMEIPIRPYEANSVQAKEVELEENLQRKNLAWPEQVALLDQIHELKGEIHGQAMKGQKDGKGWSIDDTAKMTGESPSWAGEQIRFAKKLKSRPDLANKVKHLPIKAAMKQFKKEIDKEETTRLIDEGHLVITDELIHGDSVEIMNKMEKESVDLILTDPPFGLFELVNPNDRGVVQSYTGTLVDSDNLDDVRVRKLIQSLAPCFDRVLKPTAHFYIFGKEEVVSWCRQWLEGYQYGLELHHSVLVWDKGRATAPFRGYTYSPSYEFILHGWKKPANERRMANPARDVLSFKPLSSAAKEHAFEKPQDLLMFLINQSTIEGDLVLDPFAGSASTIMAARATRRRGVGIEIDDGHYKRAMLRLGNKKEETPNESTLSVDSTLS